MYKCVTLHFHRVWLYFGTQLFLGLVHSNHSRRTGQSFYVAVIVFCYILGTKATAGNALQYRAGIKIRGASRQCRASYLIGR